MHLNTRKLSEVILFCYLIQSVRSARILCVFPTPSISHQLVFRHLTNELIRRNHEVVVITPDPAYPSGQAPENLTEVNIHDISYDLKEQKITFVPGTRDDVYKHIQYWLILYVELSERQYQSDQVRELHNNTFDVILIEDYYKTTLVFSHIFKTPVISVSSYSNIDYDNIGAPTHMLLYPGIFRTKIYGLTLWENLSELYRDLLIHHALWVHMEDNKLLINMTGNVNAPTLHQLSDNVNLKILNVHPIWDGIRPVPQTLVYMGGMMKNRIGENISQELKNYLDSSENGVIYMSFGTNVNSTLLPQNKLDIFIKVFSELPYNVLWKWESNKQPVNAKNIKTASWFPQADLLRHPNIKLFITQAGLQSTDEAIIAGVPLIGIPMLFDQWFNAEKYVHHKIGLKLEIETLDEDQLENAIKTVITDERYRQNVVKLRTLMYDQPQSALERAMWWTEHVLRHGGASHLRAPAANMSWTQYIELELLLIFSATISIVFSLFIYLVFRLLKCFRDFLQLLSKVKLISI